MTGASVLVTVYQIIFACFRLGLVLKSRVSRFRKILFLSGLCHFLLKTKTKGVSENFSETPSRVVPQVRLELTLDGF